MSCVQGLTMYPWEMMPLLGAAARFCLEDVQNDPQVGQGHGQKEQLS